MAYSQAELKWRVLLDRNDEFRSISREGQTMYVEFKNGHSLATSQEVSVKDFVLPRMKFNYPAITTIYVSLVFRVYRLGIVVPDEYRVAMRWVPSWYPDDNKSVYTAVFHPNIDRVFLLFPIDRTQDFVLNPNSQTTTALSAAALAKPTNGEVATNLAARIESQVAPHFRSREVRVRKKASFSFEGKYPTGPVSVLKYNEDGGEQLSSAYTYVLQSYVAYFRSITSVRTPNFRNLAKVNLPVNPLSITIRKVNNRQGIIRRDHTNPNGWVVKTAPTLGGIFPNAQLNAIHDVNSTNRAIAKLIKEADGDVKSNIALNLLQIDQTARLISSSANRIRRSVLFLKKGQFSKATDALFEGPSLRRSQYGKAIRKGSPSKSKTLAENWLELQYGWKPLLSDVEGALTLLAQNAKKRPSFRYVRATASTSSRGVEMRSLSSVTSPGYTAPHPVEVVKFSSCRLMLKYGLSSQQQSFLQQTGFTSPLNLAWEIIPYSFVVDWFLPIGPYLETLNAFDGMTFIDGSKTNFSRWGTFSYVRLNGVKQPGNTANTFYINGGFDQETIQVDRVKLTTFPRQVLAFKNPLSVGHALNALALLRVAFR